MRKALLRALDLLSHVIRFYPLQLPVFQLRRHPFLMALWGLLWAMALGFIGQSVGVEMIFYSPGEGLAHPALGSFAWGIAFGLFTIAYHLSTFLLDAHHAGFLLHSGRNFIFLYALNNSLLPITFLLVYIARYNQFHLESPTLRPEILALLSGTILVWALALLYFSRWKLSLRALRPLIKQALFSPSDAPPLTSGLWLFGSGGRVRYYLTIPGGIAPVAYQVPHQATLRLMEGILTRGHLSALILEVIIIGLTLLWGYIQSITDLYLPASVVVLIFGSLLLMTLGALDYWLKRSSLGLPAILVVFGLLSWKLFQEIYHISPAFGLSYDKRYLYRQPHWDTLIARQVAIDSLRFAQILQKRLANQSSQSPTFLWVTVSGGGWRAAYWSFLHLHLLDSLSNGRFYHTLAGITGASGGLIGATFWRELHLFHPDRPLSIHEANRLTQDLLNPLFSTGLIGLLSPTTYWRDTLTHTTYPKGRDYAFETRLVKNTNAFSHRLKDYTPYEESGQTPIIIFTPACLTNSLQLLISPLPASFLCWADQTPVAIELRQLVPSDNLRITSVLRMNATFPLVLPAVRLPTSPPLDIMDAGAIDNLGQSLSLRLLWKQRALLATTAKIVWIEIRDLPPQHTPTPRQPFLGGLYNAFAESRYHPNQLTLELLRTLYPIPIEKYTIHYTPDPSGYTPPLGFTLLSQDRQSLLRAAYHPDHLSHLRRILQSANLIN